MLTYLTLFGSAFLAATILPFSSEVVLYALLDKGHPAWLLIAVASIGNTLGAMVNWALGRYLLHYQDRRWFYFSADQLAAMQCRFQRYGVWVLLFSWLPLGGDVLPCIAGIMRVRWWWVVLLVGVGKTLRYLVVFRLAGLAAG